MTLWMTLPVLQLSRVVQSKSAKRRAGRFARLAAASRPS
jgi:hypothetical protein